MGVNEKAAHEKEYVVTGAMISELLESSTLYNNEKMAGKFFLGSGARYKAAMQAILGSPYQGPEAFEAELIAVQSAVSVLMQSIQRIKRGNPLTKI